MGNLQKNLKPCPACKNEIVHYDMEWQQVMCDCQSSGPGASTQEEAESKWNAMPRELERHPMNEAPEDGTLILAMGSKMTAILKYVNGGWCTGNGSQASFTRRYADEYILLSDLNSTMLSEASCD